MSIQTQKFDNIVINKKEFHKSKQPTDLDLLNIDQIAIYDKFKHSDDDFKYFIGYKEDDVIRLGSYQCDNFYCSEMMSNS